jgi:putative ABC transport system permease protein
VIVALKELTRRPGRFAMAGVAMTFLTVLLLLLGGLLDGLYLGSTGAFRAQDADVFVYSSDAQDSFLRSRIDASVRAEIEEVDGVARTDGIGVAQVAASLDDPPAESEPEDLIDVAVLGYEAGTGALPAPPPAGSAYADDRVRAEGVAVGDTILVGSSALPIEVVGFVDDASFLLQGSLWTAPETWRQVLGASRPDAVIGDDVFQVVLAHADDGVDPAELAERIDEATGGATSSLTRDEAVLSLPGTREQNRTFTGLITVTFFVVGLISSLFFALLTIERARLFAAMKALGVSNWRLLVWSVIQAAIVAASAFTLGVALTLPLAAAVPDEVPLQLEPSRAVLSGVLLVATAAFGALLTVRRTNRIDPASAIS